MSIKVEVLFTPGCQKCAKARDELRILLQTMSGQGVVWRDVDLLEELDYAVELGVLGPSAVAIDGELVFPALPKPEALRKELERRLATVG